MNRRMLAVVLVAVSFTTQYVLCEDYYHEMQDYYDFYERSHNDEAPSKEGLELKMPGVRPDKASRQWMTFIKILTPIALGLCV